VRQLIIADQKIGDGQPVLIIAEAADSHLGDMDVAREMIRQSKLAGASCIKFQHHLPDEEMLPDIPMSDNFQEPLYEFLKKHALTIQQHRELMAYCREVGITYLCTPFSYKAAQELKSIGLNAFKIGSGEFTDLTSLERIAALGNPMILSTGMSVLEEIRETYNAMKQWKVPFAFLNCVSEYPPKYEEMNIGVIQTLLKTFPDIVIGHSDHTPDLYTAFAAVTLGAKIIEKHITLDKRNPGPDQSVSIDMRDLADLVQGIRKIEASLGHEKKIQEREMQIRKWAFRSIVTTREIPAGTVLTREMLGPKDQEQGFPPASSPRLSDANETNDKTNTLVTREDLE